MMGGVLARNEGSKNVYEIWVGNPEEKRFVRSVSCIRGKAEMRERECVCELDSSGLGQHPVAAPVNTSAAGTYVSNSI